MENVDISPGLRSFRRRMLRRFGPLNPHSCPDCGTIVVRTTYREKYCKKTDNPRCWQDRQNRNKQVFRKNKKPDKDIFKCDRHVYVKGKCIVCDKIEVK